MTLRVQCNHIMLHRVYIIHYVIIWIIRNGHNDNKWNFLYKELTHSCEMKALRLSNSGPWNPLLCSSIVHWFILYSFLLVMYFNTLRPSDICVSKWAIFGSDNCLLPDTRQTIIWTNAGILLIGPLGTNFSEILIEIVIFPFIKMSSAKWRCIIAASMC